MSKLSIFLFLLVGFQSCAETREYALVIDYNIDSVRANPDLSEGTSEVVVKVKDLLFSRGDEILYGYGDETLEATLNGENTFEFTLKSGVYAFQFYPSRNVGYHEITTHNITVKPHTTTFITLDFRDLEGEPDIVKKPVIYLYPTEETEVSVSIKPVGELSFTYPKYDEKWECTATPSGEIRIGENSYNYLFWEAEQMFNKEELRKTPSAKVLKGDLLEFLEKSLDQFGFNSKEKMDFITFWAPQMIQHEATEIRFVINDECTQFADLEIVPKPTNLIRFYIIWNETAASATTSEPAITISQQNRDGFTVLEWGGVEISPSTNISLVESRE